MSHGLMRGRAGRARRRSAQRVALCTSAGAGPFASRLPVEKGTRDCAAISFRL